MGNVYDEDGIDGPWERLMDEKPKKAQTKKPQRKADLIRAKEAELRNRAEVQKEQKGS